MARSLTVKHDEQPATSSLLTGFLALAIGVLMLSTFVGFGAEADAAPVVDPGLQISE